MPHILYSFRRCPYAIRARMALKYSDIPVQIQEVSLKNKPQAMLDISPKGQVPVLVVGDKVIDESRDIMSFALSASDPDGWLQCEKEKKEQIETFITINDTSFKKDLDQYKYFDKNQQDSLEACREKGEDFLKKLEHQLKQNTYLFGDTISYGDIAIFPFIRQFAHVDKEWFYHSSYKNLQQWLDHFLASKLFQDVMVKEKILSSNSGQNLT